MMRMDIMCVVVQVPEYDAPLVHDGSDAAVRFQALNDKEIRGKVTRFSWALDTQVRTLRVEIHLPNPGERLLPAMYVNAAIRGDTERADPPRRRDLYGWRKDLLLRCRTRQGDAHCHQSRRQQ